MQTQMMDWLFDEATLTIPAELVDCRSCLDQYLALKETMGMFEQATVALQPAEEYWTGYEAKLRVKLAQEQRTSFWQHWFSRPLWLIPAAALLLLLMFGLAWSRQHVRPLPNEAAPEVASGAKPGLMQEKENEAPKAPARSKRKLDKPGKQERKEPSHAHLLALDRQEVNLSAPSAGRPRSRSRPHRATANCPQKYMISFTNATRAAPREEGRSERHPC